MDYLRQLVESFCGISEPISAALLEEEGIYSRSESEAWLNDVVVTMSQEQREALATIVRKERQSALIDALVVFDQELGDGDLEWVYEGIEVKYHADGLSLHQQYIGQLSGDDWSSNR